MRLVFEVSLPVFALVLCGYGAGVYKLLAGAGSKSLNDYVYYFALPALLFLAVATAPVDELANWQFVVANLGGIFGSFAASVVVGALLFDRGFPTMAIVGMAGSYGTTGYMGIPLLIAAFGQEAALPAALATILHNLPVIVIVILSFEIARVISSEADAEAPNAFGLARRIARAVVLNPLNLAFAAGLAVAMLDVDLVRPVGVFADLLASAAGPTALFALGLGLAAHRSVAVGGGGDPEPVRRIEVATVVLLKIVLQPLITLVLVLYVFHMEELWATVAVLMAALPVGAGVYVFAQRYESFVEQTSLAVLASMIASFVTVSLALALIPGLVS